MGLDLRKLEDLKEKMQVEEDFGLRFTTEEISSLKNVGEFKALIARKLGGRG